MAIPLTTDPGGLFVRLGAIGRLLADLRNFQKTTLFDGAVAVLAQLVSEPDLAAPMASALSGARLGAGGYANVLQSGAIGIVNRAVYRDNPQWSNISLAVSLAELIRQMVADGETIQVCTITAEASTLTGTGDGVVVLSTKRGDGLVQENAIAEEATLTCTGDAQSASATSGYEPFVYRGDVAQPSPLHYDWPEAGSGSSVSLNAVPASSDNGRGNLLSNSDFEDFTVANTPDKWTIAVGLAGTEVFSEASVFYAGLKALRLAGGTGLNTSLTQTFNSTSGTRGTLKPSTQYAHNVWLKVSAAPVSGVLTVDLIDGSGNVTADDQGVSNSYTISLPAASTSWVSYTGVFRTPSVLPSTLKLRFRLSTALASGNLYLDHMALATMTRLYAGGPYASVFSGATAFIKNDYWLLTVTNDRGGASDGVTTFQTLFDRLFNMRALDLLLPSSDTPTINDDIFDYPGSLDFSVATNSQYLSLI